MVGTTDLSTSTQFEQILQRDKVLILDLTPEKQISMVKCSSLLVQRVMEKSFIALTPGMHPMKLGGFLEQMLKNIITLSYLGVYVLFKKSE